MVVGSSTGPGDPRRPRPPLRPVEKMLGAQQYPIDEPPYNEVPKVKRAQGRRRAAGARLRLPISNDHLRQRRRETGSGRAHSG